jgi:CheY-like chemotaxis protein
MKNRLIRIWVVNDNPADVCLLRDALHCAGLNSELLTIGDGAEAAALMRLEEMSGRAAVPDLVVLDSSLSEADGIEVLEAMRQSNVPVMMTSCLISPPDRARKVEEFFHMIPALNEAVSGNRRTMNPTRIRRRLIPERADRPS